MLLKKLYTIQPVQPSKNLSTNIRMALSILVSGSNISDMALDRWSGLMELFIKANGSKVKLKDLESFITSMETTI